MNCREAEQQIFAARDGALADAQRATLDSHLEQCAACRRVQNDLMAFVEMWRAETEDARVPDAGFEWRKLQRRVANQVQPRRSLLPWLALPSAALVAAAVAVGVYLKPNTPDAPITRPPAIAAVATTAARATGTAAAAASGATAPSAVVFVDDKSGWTFVWDGDTGQHI